MHTTTKGSIALSKVINECLKKSYQVYLPFDQHTRADLIIERNGKLEKIQVKYAESDNQTIIVRCRSVNSYQIKKYTSEEIDIMAVYDLTSDKCYYMNSSILGVKGRNQIILRLVPTKSNQEKRVLWAKDFLKSGVRFPQAAL